MDCSSSKKDITPNHQPPQPWYNPSLFLKQWIGRERGFEKSHPHFQGRVGKCLRAKKSQNIILLYFKAINVSSLNFVTLTWSRKDFLKALKKLVPYNLKSYYTKRAKSVPQFGSKVEPNAIPDYLLIWYE